MRGIWRCVYIYDIVAGFGFLTEVQRLEFRDTLVERIHWAIGPQRPSAIPCRQLAQWEYLLRCPGGRWNHGPGLPGTVGVAGNGLSSPPMNWHGNWKTLFGMARGTKVRGTRRTC